MGLALRAIGQKQSATEHQLVAAVRQGDDRAFEELFSRYRSRITGYVLGMVRDYARAEDITQEVFLSALRRLRDSERPIAFKPWIYEIARNACIDEFRRTRRTAEVSLNADEETHGADRGLVSKQPTPDAAMENKQRLEALRGAFRGLSENHHRILVMRELEGLSYSEIASRMGMSRPMVESTLFRARRRLGEEFQELSSGRRCQQVREVVERADASTIRVLGIRARRQVALHLSHCDDCRRHARLAGADDALFRAPTFADKVAALLPFGWLGRRLAGSGRSATKPAAHGFIARHVSSATQYLGPVGSGAILGRVAAAVFVIAAAGGGYAGVTMSGSSSSVHNAAATVPRSVAAAHSSTVTGNAGAPRQASMAATAAALRQSPHGRAQIAKLGSGAGGAAGSSRGGPSAAPGHGGSGKAVAGGSSSAGAPSAAHTSSSTLQPHLLSNSPASNLLGPVLTPITSHVPPLPKKTTGGPVRPPSVPKLPGVPQAVPAPSPLPSSLPSSAPSPQTLLNQTGQTGGNLTAGPGKALRGLTTPAP